jgi:glycosyltransferase involved in cell wall biosynthesis
LKAIREGRTAYPTGGILEISGDYGPNLVEEITRYGRVAEAIAQHESFDVIHAHDWMTVFAGVRASQVSGKPYIYHVHALEYDRSGENMNRDIFDIEHYGLKSADHIIAVSHYTKKMIVARYGIPPGKITVVYNGVDSYPKRQYKQEKKHPGKVVLFLGRITFQKGPDYFVEAAAKVLEKKSDITFVMAGSGDMLPRMIERVAELGIGKHFHFTGFLHGADVERIYGASDLYVMPSVSEPFGISPLEAAAYEVPVIISKQSGVSEVMNHVLKVDFWDVRELANKILAALTYRALPRQLSEEGIKDLKNLTWGKAARKTLSVYHKVCR